MYDRLSRIDLNLLLAFQVLLEEKNTTRAAERLFITQSAMSRTLSRLRQAFDDELFFRHGHGLKTTPKAEALTQLVDEVLAKAHGIFCPEPFNPAAAMGEINLAIPEPIAIFVVPSLVKRLKTLAPKLILNSHNVHEDYCEQLQNGSIDFLVYQHEKREELTSELIGSHRLTCLMRKGHPLASTDSMAEKEYSYTDHIVYTVPHVNSRELDSFIDSARHFEGNQYCILETTQLLMAFELMLNSDAILPSIPGTQDLAICRGQFSEKTFRDLPISNKVVDQYLTQHKRSLNLPLHQWMAKQITEVASEALPLVSS